MYYLTLIPDLFASGLKDDFKGYIQPEDLALPADLCERIRSWDQLYQRVIPLDEAQRREPITAKFIEELDTRGLLLAREIPTHIAGGAKIKYYSEGLLRILS